MKSAVTISLVEEARGGPFVLWDGLVESCKMAKQYGFDAVEIFAGDASVFKNESLQSILDDQQLDLAAAGTGAGWVRAKLTLSDPLPQQRQKAIDFVKSIIDAVAPWRSHVIVGSMQGRADSKDAIPAHRKNLAESLRELAGYAKSNGSTLLIEPLNRYETNLVNTVADGLELIEQSSSDNLKLLCDIFHMNIEEERIDDALRLAANAVGHIHFVDSNRRAVGFGHIEYAPIIAALRNISYDGYLSAEVLPLPDSKSACQQTIASFRTLTNS